MRGLLLGIMAMACGGLLLCTSGCQQQPTDRFLPEDLAALQAVCQTPPYPESLSILENQVSGHLKQVLAKVDWISAEAYVHEMTLGTGEGLQNRAAVVVLSDINSSTASGVLLLLFGTNAPGDVIQIPLMYEGDAHGGHPSTWDDPPQVKLRYPFNWFRADTEPDGVLDHLFYVSTETKARYIDPEGQPRFEFRWGGP